MVRGQIAMIGVNAVRVVNLSLSVFNGATLMRADPTGPT